MFLSCGKPLKTSCELGIKYVNQSIKSNLNYGKGNGPINHLNSIKVNKEETKQIQDNGVESILNHIQRGLFNTTYYNSYEDCLDNFENC